MDYTASDRYNGLAFSVFTRSAMPELPEVETMVRGIRPYVEGRRISAVRQCPCQCKPISIVPGLPEAVRRMRGTTVRRVRRLAKRVVLELSSGDAVVIEPRMTGLMLLADPPDRGHLRLEWRFAGRRKFNTLWFWDRRGLGTVRIYSLRELEQKLGSGKLGPDALAMTPAKWQASLAATRRPIKVALLDQRLAAGIGNLYASEILHLARIHPEHRSDALSAGRVKTLHLAVLRVLREAIRHEGSTLGDATYRNVLSQNGSYQNQHRVYQRAGEQCGSCRRGRIVRIVQAQRSTFFCPWCQRRKGGRG